jgi:hypothetical protein
VLASRSFCLRLRGISFQLFAGFVLVCLRFFLSHAMLVLVSCAICFMQFVRLAQREFVRLFFRSKKFSAACLLVLLSFAALANIS